MTTNTPALAQDAVLTDEEIRSIWVEHGLDDEAVEDFARAIESALLSKLRAPVADERAAFIDWLTGSYPNAYSEPEAVRLWHHGHVSALAWKERGRRAALASAPVADERTAEHIATLQRMRADYSPRNGPMSELKAAALGAAIAALASAPVAGKAPPTDDDILVLALDHGAISGAQHFGPAIRFARALLSQYAAPQASEAVRDADHPVFTFLLGEGPLRGVHFGDRHPDERGAYWWRKDLRAAMSAQPGAQKGGSDA
ncbi:hypothetical protein DBL07_25955 [Achromobacter mucicolens]|uniref:hypothetical protein n=1 Tax=Achromobacter mucicolens TaxID=1389922 RepID=UPI000D468E39|nr:hypothetical protein [Achromobacter mucicolens]PTW84019.1 hypothetical protein DBL07_25955 [Achromobacter mucicolens]